MKEMIKKLQKRSNKKGFTLVEIIVVLVILAILAAIAVPAVLGYVQDAKDSKYISEARSIYIVVQTEEAKLKAEANNKDLVITAENYTAMNSTAKDKCGFNTVTITHVDAQAGSGSTAAVEEHYHFEWKEKASDSTHKADVFKDKEVKIVK